MVRSARSRAAQRLSGREQSIPRTFSDDRVEFLYLPKSSALRLDSLNQHRFYVSSAAGILDGLGLPNIHLMASL